ncbi:uncharacterized protein LOC129242902 [Anastrepha obliqua]|uniref:uncharacterized protein LOC129242902 n=1 Tax=Anastrepha obliqua TaxID=95512 RepID=UPI00240A4B4E|nr:uncharacterized protein LOC129242902 [Anastrepha obliqua]
MGVEKNGSETRLSKTNSIDLYKPPALRNHNQSADQVDTTATATFAKIGSVNATVTTTVEASCAAAATAETAAITTTAVTIGKTPLLSTSISCNNSPTHANENKSFDNNAVTSRCVSDSDCAVTTTTTSTSGTAVTINSASPTTEAEAMPDKPVTSAVVSNSSGQQRQSSVVRRERRPDRAVYIPRARRSQTTPPTTPAATAVEVTGIQQQQHQQATATIAPSTASLIPTTMPPTTVCNNNSSSSNGGGSNQQQLAITSETKASVYTAASTKLDEISDNRNTAATVVSAGKKIKSATVSSRERRERSKKTNVNVVSHDAKISKLSLERSETKQQQNGHDSIVFPDTRVSKESLLNQSQQQQQQTYLNTDNLQRSSLFEQQSTEATQIPAEIILNNEMNSNSGKRNKVKRSSSGNASKVQNIRIEDVASKENGTRSTTKCDIEAQEFQRASKEINRSNRRIIKQTFVSDVLEIPEKIEHGTENDKDSSPRSPNIILQLPVPTISSRSTIDSTTEEEEEDDWETLYDDSGECLDPKIMQELTASVGKVKIELPKMDYSAYLTKQSILNDEEFPHVLEVSNFPVEFKNHDLLMVFSQYKESGFDIKWVDDTHALAVFSSSRIAAEVLTMGHPFVKLKPLAEATAESRLKAKKCAASLQPYRQRPETCAALARRLVTGALGVRLKTAAAERENEKRVLREAKERKMLAAKQRDEIWES